MDRGIQVVSRKRCDLIDVIGILMQKVFHMDLPVFIGHIIASKRGCVCDLQLRHQIRFQLFALFGKPCLKRFKLLHLGGYKLFPSLLCHIPKVAKSDLLFFKQILFGDLLLRSKLLHDLRDLSCLLRFLISGREDPECDPRQGAVRIGIDLEKVKLRLLIPDGQVIGDGLHFPVKGKRYILFCLIHRIILRAGCFNDFVAAKEKLPGERAAILPGGDGIHLCAGLQLYFFPVDLLGAQVSGCVRDILHRKDLKGEAILQGLIVVKILLCDPDLSFLRHVLHLAQERHRHVIIEFQGDLLLRCGQEAFRRFHFGHGIFPGFKADRKGDHTVLVGGEGIRHFGIIQVVRHGKQVPVLIPDLELCSPDRDQFPGQGVLLMQHDLKLGLLVRDDIVKGYIRFVYQDLGLLKSLVSFRRTIRFTDRPGSIKEGILFRLGMAETVSHDPHRFYALILMR